MDYLERFFWSTQGKSFYAKLTLTRFTILYFSLALLSCITLVILQAVTLADNHAGIQALSKIVSGSDAVKNGLPVFLDGKLTLCTGGLPGQANVTCRVLFGWDTLVSASENIAIPLGTRSVNDIGRTLVPASPVTTGVVGLRDDCMHSLRWLAETMKDNIREDVVTLCFQIWLLSLAFVTLLYQSIPHLGAGILGHILGTGWAAYRIRSTVRLTTVYRRLIVPGVCSGQDLLGNWWEQRRSHAVGIVVVNSCVLVALTYLSYKLLKVYANQSFACVGASEKIWRIYKVIMLFSVGLQLTGFFSLASIGMWLDKVSHGVLRPFTIHKNLYCAAFIITLVLLVPWVYLGWACVRRECVRRYGVFCAISLFLVTLLTSLFFSPIYRFIFLSWSFFATITVTSYACVVITAILSVLCRLNFDKGFAHYLQVNDALADDNFTAGTFSNNFDHKHDPELAFPLPPKLVDTRGALAHQLTLTQTRGSSIYSRSESDPIKLSSTPPNVKNLISVPSNGATNKTAARIIITRAVSVKEDPLPPMPSVQGSSVITRTGRGRSSLIRISDLPERLSSLTSLRQTLSQFPSPPHATRPSNLSKVFPEGQ